MNQPLTHRRRVPRSRRRRRRRVDPRGNRVGRCRPRRRRQGEARDRRRHAGAQEPASAPQPYGPQFYDDVEKRELLDVLESKSPFRWRGAGRPRSSSSRRSTRPTSASKYALGVTSGTTALYTAMAALEIGPGDEVILPAWTWYADYDAIVLSGAPAGLRRDRRVVRHRSRATSRRKITPRTKAIMAVHLQGCPADMDRDPRDRPQAQAPRPGRLRPVRRRALQGEVRRHHRRHRHQQLPAQQDHHLGRGRRRDHQRPEALRAGLPLPRRSARSARPTPRLGRRPAGGLCRVQLPHERVHRRGPLAASCRSSKPSASACAPTPARSARPSPICRDCKLRKSPDLDGETGRRGLPRPGHQPAARAIPPGDGGRGRSRLGAGRIGDPSGRCADRAQGDHPPRLALLQHAPGQGHPLRPRVLPAHDRHPRPPRRRDDGPQLH